MRVPTPEENRDPPRAVDVSREQPPVLEGPRSCKCSSAEAVMLCFSPLGRVSAL